MKPEMIKSAFRQTGILPFNPRVVLDKMKETSLETYESSSNDEYDDIPESSFILRTPRKINSLERYADLLKDNVRDTDLTTQVLVNKFVKGALVAAHTGAQAEQDFAQSEAAQQARKNRAEKRKRQVCDTSVISVGMARQRLFAKDLKEAVIKRPPKKLEAKFVRLFTELREKYGPVEDSDTNNESQVLFAPYLTRWQPVYRTLDPMDNLLNA